MIRLHDAHDASKQRRLPCTVGANEANDVVGVDIHRNALQHMMVTKSSGEVAD